MAILAVENDLARLIEGKSDGEKVEVEVALLREFLEHRREKTLTTQQAAELLGVSRPFVIKLIDEGKLAAQKVGTHRRIRESEARALKVEIQCKRDEAMDEIVRMTEEMGLYEHQQR